MMVTEQPDLAGQTLADALVRLRCHGCRRRDRLTVHLCETPHAAGPQSGTVTRGWALLLHEASGDGLGIVARAAE